MKAVRPIQEKSSGKEYEIIVSKVILARSFSQKLFGLLARKPLEPEEGLLIEGCNSIHTIGMRYKIDAVFMDRAGKVVAVFENLRPFRITPYVWKAYSVLELRSGAAVKNSINIGDIIGFKE